MAAETVIETNGLIDALTRILRELIHTPKFRELVIMLLKSIDPPAARKLVRVLFWEDTGFFLSLVGAVPSLVNVGSEFVAEMAAQMNTMPTPLLQEFVGGIIDGIDGAAAGEAAGGLVSMALSLQGEDSELPQSLASLGEKFGHAYREAAGGTPLIGRLAGWMQSVAARARDKESSTYAFIQEAEKALRQNPDFVEYVLKPLIAPVLGAPGAAPSEEE